MRLRSICRAILTLDVAYCAASLVLPALPAWKMFESSSREPFTITDGDGRAIDAYAWVPRGVPELDAHDAVRIARWLCTHGHALAPVRIEAPSFQRTLGASECASVSLAPR